MKKVQSFSFIRYLKLGREQAYATSSLVKRKFFALFGSLQINPRIRSGRVISEIMKLKLPEEATILDAGFGQGLGIFALSQQYPQWKIFGYEIDDTFFNKAKKIKKEMCAENLTIVKKDIQAMDDNNRFDLIYSCDVLEHIEDDIKVLSNFKNALHPKGILLLHLPLQYERCRRIFPFFGQYTTKDHVRDEYTPEEIQEKLEQTGFQIDFINYGYGLLKGELAFELNNFFRSNKLSLVLSQVSTFPISLMLGFLDIKYPPVSGNSLVIKARINQNL